MTDQHRDDSTRRLVLKRDQRDDQSRASPAPTRVRRPNRPFRKLIPVLLFSGFAVLIAYKEIPAFSGWLEKGWAPVHWQAKQTCQQSALQNATNPNYARVLETGEAHDTKEGLYVDKLVLGEMGKDGTEQAIEYSCYLDAEGGLVRLNRL